MCTPAPVKMLKEMIDEGRSRAEGYKTSQFMSPRGDNGVEVQNQQPPPGKFFGNISSPMANAMVGMAIAKGNGNGYQTSKPINVNTSSNKTGRVIS